MVDLDKDGHLDLVATARLAQPALHIWLGDGKDNFTPLERTWTDTGYAALATGDVNRDGFPDIVSASHFATVQTLLSNGSGGFTETILRRSDGYTGAQLGDLNGDGCLDLVLLGFENAGIEIYFGDGTGNWTFHKSLPETKPDETMPGRDLFLADLNHDGHLDVIAAFQRWGMYIYYGDGRGGFTGGPVDFRSPAQEVESLAVADVNKDGHLDIAVNGTSWGRAEANGPDVYLGDGSGKWRASSDGLKTLKIASAGIAIGDLNQDGSVDIVAAGNLTGHARSSAGLFWFRGDGHGGWSHVQESGLPGEGLSVPHSVTLADIDHDGVLEIIALNGGVGGSITIWKRQ